VTIDLIKWTNHLVCYMLLNKSIIIWCVACSKQINNLLVCCMFSESMLAEIHKQIEDAFEVFDHEGNKTVDVRLLKHVFV